MRVVMVPGWQAKVRPHLLRFQRNIAGEVYADVLANIVSDGTIRTGAMVGSVRQEGARVYIGTDHWHFIEYGTDPHPIYPNVKRALWWEGLDHPVGMVNHPGNREYAPMRRALYKKRG
jgi:hypothetical protein